jgi:hypothetical protein
MATESFLENGGDPFLQEANAASPIATGMTRYNSFLMEISFKNDFFGVFIPLIIFHLALADY